MWQGFTNYPLFSLIPCNCFFNILSCKTLLKKALKSISYPNYNLQNLIPQVHVKPPVQRKLKETRKAMKLNSAVGSHIAMVTSSFTSSPFVWGKASKKLHSRGPSTSPLQNHCPPSLSFFSSIPLSPSLYLWVHI